MMQHMRQTFSKAAGSFAIGLGLFVGPAEALSICTINLSTNGTMVVSPDLTTLGSKLLGGAPGLATITTSGAPCNHVGDFGCLAVSTIAPLSFSQAPGGASSGTTFISSYSVDGGAESPAGLPRNVLNGNHTIQVNLVASKTASIFPAGNYRAQVTLLCE